MPISEVTNEDNMVMMARYPDKFFDFICEDPPYGSTNLKWDRELDYVDYFKDRFRILKDNGLIAVFSHQPFATDVINGCRKFFRYEIIWQKSMKTNFANAKKMPLRGHENILIFYKKLPKYNPQRYYSASSIRSSSKKSKNGLEYEGYQGGFNPNYKYTNTNGMIMFDSVVKFANWNGGGFVDGAVKSIHPTQKPVPLYTHLIKTFTNHGDKIFDGFMGSGSLRIACKDENRDFYGCELDKDYFDAQELRFKNHISQQKLFAPSSPVHTQTTLL